MQCSVRFDALSSRDFRLFLAGHAISMTGSWMQSVAQGWLVYTLTKSPLSLGLVAICLSAPVMLLSLFGGVVADKSNKRELLVKTQLLAMLPALLLAVLTVSGQITVGWVMGLAFLLGTVNAIELPARQAFLVELVNRSQLTSAITLNSVVFNATRIAGPVLAGFTIAAAGLAACFVINAASFLAGIGSLLLIKRHSSCRLAPAVSGRSMFDELREGLRYVAGERQIAMIMLLVVVVSLFGIPFVPLLPVFADGVLKVGPQGLGLLAGACGVGSMVAALALAWRGEIRKKGQLIVAAGLLFAVGLFLFANALDYQTALLSLLFVGAGMVCFLAMITCYLQHRCPDLLRGRVMGVYTLVLIGMAPFGHALMGFLTGRFGVSAALSLGSAVCAAAILLSSRPLLRLI